MFGSVDFEWQVAFHVFPFTTPVIHYTIIYQAADSYQGQTLCNLVKSCRCKGMHRMDGECETPTFNIKNKMMLSNGN